MPDSDKLLPRSDDAFDNGDFDYEFDEDFEEADGAIEELEAAHEGDFTTPPFAPEWLNRNAVDEPE